MTRYILVRGWYIGTCITGGSTIWYFNTSYLQCHLALKKQLCFVASPIWTLCLDSAFFELFPWNYSSLLLKVTFRIGISYVISFKQSFENYVFPFLYSAWGFLLVRNAKMSLPSIVVFLCTCVLYIYTLLFGEDPISYAYSRVTSRAATALLWGHDTRRAVGAILEDYCEAMLELSSATFTTCD